MLNWTFDPSKYKKEDFELIPEGDYRVRIENAEESTTKSGKPMIVLTLKVNGFTSTMRNWVVLDSSNQDFTNQRLGRIFDSFQIQAGNLNLAEWKGKTGGAHIEHDKYTNKDGKELLRAQISKFLIREEVDALPAWQCKAGGTINSAMVNPDEDRLPF